MNNLERVGKFIFDKVRKSNKLEYHELLDMDEVSFDTLAKPITSSYGFGPHDFIGNKIKIGSEVAVAVSAGYTSAICIGIVVKIISMDKVKLHIKHHSYRKDMVGTNHSYDTKNLVVIR